MRLICPNCGAQYEVPDGVIPEQGRDVQCSNCAHTWFQAHPDHDAELAEELDQDLPQTPETEPEPDAAPEPEPDFVPEPGQDEQNDTEDEPQDHPAEDAFDPPQDSEDTPAAPARRELDPSIAELLREEAELETRQRQSESSGLEFQPDLGFEDSPPDEGARRALEARRRMASRQGTEENTAEPDTATPDTVSDHTGSRRELLPDIEEINSSLNADGRRPASADDHLPGAETAHAAAKPSGFRRGFALGLLIIVLAWALYVFADQIAAKVPQLSGPLEQYTQGVDKGRLWLDAQAKTLLVKLDAMAAASEK